MMKNPNQKGFYIMETLISIALFFAICLTLLPIQFQLLVEKKASNEEEAVIYFLSEEMHQTLLNGIPKEPLIDHKVIGRPITLQFTSINSLIKGCVTWENAKNKVQTKCLYGKAD